MRDTERKLEKKRKKKGGSNGEKLREWEKKRNCLFDAKKVCPVTDGVMGQNPIAKPRYKMTLCTVRYAGSFFVLTHFFSSENFFVCLYK